MSIYIVATGAYCEKVTDELPVLKNLVKEVVGKHVRRVSRFIQLALIGAGRAATRLPQDAAIYLASRRADIAVTRDVLDDLYRRGQAPNPLSFINTVSNAACFYVAQSLALQGAGTFATSCYFSLESALSLAMLDLEQQRVEAALVGVVDVLVATADEHRRCLGLDGSTPVAEGSHWFQLVRDPGGRPALARLERVRQFIDRQSLSQWLSEQAFAGDNYLATGQFIGEAERAEWLNHTGLRSFETTGSPGYLDSQLAWVLCQFIAVGRGTLLHLNCDPQGRYMLVIVVRE